MVGLVLLFFTEPFSLLAVFYEASEFNSDVSNWNTGAVTSMDRSKCTLSLYLLAMASSECNDNSRFVGSQISHVLFFCSFVV